MTKHNLRSAIAIILILSTFGFGWSGIARSEKMPPGQQKKMVTGQVAVMPSETADQATTYTLLTDTGSALTLTGLHETLRALESGQRYTFSGVQRDQTLAITGAKRLGQTRPAAASTGTDIQKTLILPVYFSDTAAPTWPLISDISGTIDGSATSSDAYFRENSNNAVGLSAFAPSTTWLQIPSAKTCSVSYAMLQEALTAVHQQNPTAVYTDTRHIVMVADYGSCYWAGMAWVGSNFSVTSSDGAITIPLTSVTWVQLYASIDTRVVTHELGHGFGLDHSQFYNCGMDSLLLGCAVDPYADNISVMGNVNIMDLSIMHREVAGWTNDQSLITVPSSCTITAPCFYDLNPIAAGTGLLGLKIPRSVAGSYTGFHRPDALYIDMRQALGFDALPSNNVGQTFDHDGVMLHVSGTGIASMDMNEVITGPYTTQLIDPTIDSTHLGDPYDSVLPVGRSFTDPVSHAKVTVVSSSATGQKKNGVTIRSVRVKVSAGTIIDTDPPNAVLASPYEGLTYNQSVPLVTNATDDLGIWYAWYVITSPTDPTFWKALPPVYHPNGGYTLNTAGYANGQYQVYAVVRDIFHKIVTTNTITFTVAHQNFPVGYQLPPVNPPIGVR